MFQPFGFCYLFKFENKVAAFAINLIAILIFFLIPGGVATGHLSDQNSQGIKKLEENRAKCKVLC